MSGYELASADAPPLQGRGRLEFVLQAFAAAPMDSDIPRLVVSQAVAAVGAHGGVVTGLDGERLVVLASEGYAPGEEKACGPLMVGDLSLPLTYAVTTGEPVWLGSQARTQERFPRIIDLVPGPERAYAALPLRTEGVLLGVMGISFHERHDFTSEDRASLQALVDVCAVHLQQWRLLRSQTRAPTSVAALGGLLSALSEADTVERIARVIAEEGAAAAAATFANIALLDNEADTASLFHAPTLVEAVAARYTTITVDDSTSLGTALGSGQEVWLRSLTDLAAKYPALLDDTVAAGLSATAALPLLGRDHRVIGAMGLAWKDPQEFVDSQRDEIRVVAQLAAHALARERQRTRLEHLTQALDSSAQRLHALQRVTAALASSVTTEEIARVVVEDGIALFADHGVAAMIDPEHHVLRTWASSGFPHSIRDAHAVVALDADLPIAAAARDDTLIVANSQSEAVAQSPATAHTYLATGTHSTLAVPAHVDGRVVGALALGFNHEGAVDDDTIMFATTLADLMGQALRRGAQYEHLAHIAEVLQRSLLPRLPDVAGLEMAAVYSPADHSVQVGGDWYDVIDLGEGHAFLVIGDVMGHDIRAAAVMGQLRAAVHCYATIGHTPAQILQQLDHLVEELPDIDLVTCLCAVYDAPTHQLTVANAGHLPPMTFGGNRATALLSVPTEAPLGAGGGVYSETVHVLTPNTWLALFSDGLVESRTHGIDEGLTRLAAFLDTGHDQILADIARQTVDHMAVHTMSEDDAALLLLRPR